MFCLSLPPRARLPITTVAYEATFLTDLRSSIENEKTVHSPAPNLYSGANLYRQVQSSILIGHVTDLFSDQDPLSEQSQSRFRQLDSQLRRAIQITLEIETENLNSVSEALAMNRRYQCLYTVVNLLI
jgi:hypothetical protein